LITDLISPTGKVYIKSNVGTLSATRFPPYLYTEMISKNRTTIVTDGLASTLVPNRGVAEPLEAGVWKLRFANIDRNIKKNAKLFFKVLEKTTENQKTVNFDFITSLEIKNLTVSQLEHVKKSIEDFYSKYNISINLNLKQRHLPKLKNNELDKEANRYQNNNSINPVIYLLTRSNIGRKKDFQGIDGCLPGFIPQFINKHCSMLISLDDKENINLDKMIKVISHEIAHFFGVFHLSDDFSVFGILQDPLEDTIPDEDKTNVMHKTSDVFDHIRLTPQQVNVIKRHPLLFQFTSK
jgi:hypothetical protein